MSNLIEMKIEHMFGKELYGDGVGVVLPPAEVPAPDLGQPGGRRVVQLLVVVVEAVLLKPP